MTESKPVCVQDVEDIAKYKLPEDRWIYYASGAAEEDTLKENRQAFRRIQLRPRVLRGISEADLSTTILGQPIRIPICISPTACHKMAHPDGEIATVRAAAAYKTCMTLSYAANSSIEDVSDAGPSAIKWFQLVFAENVDLVKKNVRKAEKAGFKAIAVTCDSQAFSKRFRSERCKFKFPPKFSAPNLELPDSISGLGFADALRKAAGKKAPAGWEHVKWLKSYTKLPIVLKGILTSDDAKLAVESGADAIWVSNHGGRQLDGVPATIDVLAEIVDAVQGHVEVYLDGGVRLGTDVFKALALGARAVFVGRPVIWGLAYKGEEGVKEVLGFLQDELRAAMILSGCGKLADITRRHVITTPSTKL